MREKARCEGVEQSMPLSVSLEGSLLGEGAAEDHSLRALYTSPPPCAT